MAAFNACRGLLNDAPAARMLRPNGLGNRPAAGAATPSRNEGGESTRLTTSNQENNAVRSLHDRVHVSCVPGLDIAGDPAMPFQILRRDGGVPVQVLHGLAFAPFGVAEDSGVLGREDYDELAHAMAQPFHGVSKIIQ